MSEWQPAFRDVPERIAVDDLLLRPFDDGDVPALVAVVNANLEHLRPWMPWAQEPVTAEAERGFVEFASGARATGNEFLWGIFSAGGEILGGVGLHARNGPGVLEIGYWLAADATGRGVATRASWAVTRLAADLPGVDRIEIRCDERNARSAGIPDRLGYVLIETETRPPTTPGESDRHQIWSIDVEVVRRAT